ncbi:MAG: hypothetical protein MJ079_03035 [Ruminococcus sp.]|nr:hypothetical protein [Ruminococcus sp.]
MVCRTSYADDLKARYIRKHVKIKFKRQTCGSNEGSLLDIMPMTVAIPSDYINLDELLMRLRSLS